MDQSGDRTLIAVDVVDEALRPQQLKAKQMCRLCLAQDAPLSSIFTPQTGPNRTPQTPLSLQITACVSIEVYAGDGMPGVICHTCRILLNYHYQFKQICQTADSQLKLFLTTGIWPEKLSLPKELISFAANVKDSQHKANPRANATINIINASSGGESESNRERKINIIKLSPNDLKNLKLSQRIGTTGYQGTPPAGTMKRDQSVVSVSTPLLTSTPMPKRDAPTKMAKQQGVRLQYHDEQKSPPAQQNKDQPLVKQNLKSPVILNRLASMASKRQNVKEEFVTTGDGTVEMILQFEPEPVESPEQENIFPCTECPRTFKLKQLLDLHKINHKRERNFPCEECDKRFFSKYDLAKHRATHTGERPYGCVICGAAFSRSTLLTRHQAQHKDDLTYPCVFCERVFVSQEELDKHAQTHEKNRPFVCTDCPKSFAYKQGLERHAAVHAKELPHKCEYCDMSFHTSAALSRHLTAHAGSRPYPCRLCKKSFMLSHHLSRHLRAHNTAGQCEYKCNDCKQSFDGKNELIAHSEVHAKETLVCPLCRELFEDIDEVVAHIHEHAKKNQYACDYCDLLYTSEQKLNAHCQHEHADELACEWSEEQQRQLNEEQAASRKEVAANQPKVEGDSKSLTSGEEMKTDVVLDSENSEIENIFLEPEDYDTAIFMQPEGNEQVIETFEVNEYVEETPSEVKPKVSPQTKHPKQVKQERLSPLPKSKDMTRQKSMVEFFKRNQEAVEKKTAQRNVSEMLKNLPKGVTIKREQSAPSLTTNPPKKPSQPIVVEKKQPQMIPIEKDKSPIQGSSKGTAQAMVVEPKRRPGRPPKIVPKVEESEGKKENVAIKKVEPVVMKKEERKQQHTKLDEEIKKVLSDRKSTVEGGLKRSGTMNFPKTRVGIDVPPKTFPSAAGASSKGSVSMVRRSYAVPPSKEPMAGIKRPADKESATDEPVSSKRFAPGPQRKTMNPAMLSTLRNTTQKSAKAGEPVQVNVVRTVKREPNADAPVEMNVGGKTVKLQKLILSKSEALALQKAGKLKGKI
ncbi:transcriptional repressor CTCF [Anopheles ziemanni]|uniref:transcriptional repressor CTCF n=1 Tax=Anopheles coustani TaxID=139045 RepID=UPI002658FA17|nr:transcriptional repressor CTCF [Anopheles coustani]XP_058177419.1 transcriptional repressor CTCF [Anopheles ziemanni]